jgi:OFA family oxalate/formate antiporter-like MFS transporter
VNRGWWVTAGGTGALLALYLLYAWSVIRASLPEDWGWTEAQKALPYSVAILAFSLMMLPGARLFVRIGPRATITLGGLLAGLGLALSSITRSPWVFSVAFGLLLGTGIGFVYSSATPAALRWFSASRSGLVSGIIVGGFGLGSAWAPVLSAMVGSFGLQASLLYLGIGIPIVVAAFARLVCLPPSGYSPPDTPEGETPIPDPLEHSPAGMARSWQFYGILASFSLAAGAGLMVVGSLASIAREQFGLPAISALAVSALTLGNGAGRMLYGLLSDRFGRKPVLLFACLLQAGLFLVLSRVTAGGPLSNIPVVFILSALVGANYGANLAIFPVLTREYFGRKHFALNYSYVFLAWGFGGFIISQLGGVIKGHYGTFTPTYILGLAILLVAAFLIALSKPPQEPCSN